MPVDSDRTPARLTRPRTDVFISYSHKDKKWLEQLQKMLKPIIRKGGVTIWDDTRIRPGSKWRQEITRALDSAGVAVLLVSPDFLDSDFIHKYELPPLLAAAEQEGLTILWIAVRPSLYEETPIGEYQSANHPNQALSKLSGAKRDEEWVRICKKIKEAIAAGSVSAAPPEAAAVLREPAPAPRSDPGPVHEARPDELIDFDDQRCTFDEMLQPSAAKQLMFIRARSGRGKTSFLRMVRFRCQEQAVPCCSIDFRGQPYDNPHFTLALAMCQQLGLSPYNLAQALRPLSMYRQEGDLTGPEKVNQVLAGVSVVHEGLRQRYMKDRLREAFLADLNQFAQKHGHAACLFDSFEDVSAEEEAWLLDTLLQPVAGGKLRNVLVVIAGQNWARIDDRQWVEHAHLVETLPAMKIEHMKLYAEKVNIKISDEEASYYWKASGGGIPLYMAMVIHNLSSVSEVGS